MTTDDIRELYQYDRWANHRVLQAASALTPEQFTRDLGGSFPSVRGVLVHILAAEWIWLTYWSGPSHDSSVFIDLRKQRDAIFDPQRFPDLASAQSKWTEIEQLQIAFLDRITDDLLATMLPSRLIEETLAHQMHHLANHSTYHRGQVSLMMRQLHAEPVATDFLVFMAERRARS